MADDKGRESEMLGGSQESLDRIYADRAAAYRRRIRAETPAQSQSSEEEMALHSPCSKVKDVGQQEIPLHEAKTPSDAKFTQWPPKENQLEESPQMH
ncbi:hypothetical protein AVEN_47682-1 [Araneus ventricosus]|uniref:Uncharacterized protein n=1 Tax=Araneus ventricosus TaxID=182803 RepID=A0A4Y2MW04_ARAVE|nr:hypothetical protein AVEN_47682-1 [Araneus ventricosus]